MSVAECNGGEVRYCGEIANTPEAVEKLVRQLRKYGATLSFCYKAGPCGYGLQRHLTDLGWDCMVVAPSLIPKKAGERVKTDRRDSLSLARLYRAGELTAVCVPDEQQEALRDLTQAHFRWLEKVKFAQPEKLCNLFLRGALVSSGSATTCLPTSWCE